MPEDWELKAVDKLLLKLKWKEDLSAHSLTKIIT